MAEELSNEHVASVCRLGQRELTCSFLSFGTGGWLCAKGTGIEATIRQRRAEGLMTAKGDNCSGPPDYEVST